jgi:hypothetical protein
VRALIGGLWEYAVEAKKVAVEHLLARFGKEGESLGSHVVCREA